MGENGDTLYRMEDVVRRTGLTPRAIRYYEEVGLLAPSGRTAGGFRLFTEAEIERLVRIKDLQTLLGFSLAEIKETLQTDAMRAELRQQYAQATDPQTRLQVLGQGTDLIESQIRVIEERMARLAKLREEYEQRLARIRSLREEIIQGSDAVPADGHRPQAGLAGGRSTT